MSDFSDDENFVTACTTPTSDLYTATPEPLSRNNTSSFDGEDAETSFPWMSPFTKALKASPGGLQDTHRLSSDGSNPWGLPTDTIKTLLESVRERTEAWRKAVEDGLGRLPPARATGAGPATPGNLTSALTQYMAHLEQTRKFLVSLVDLVGAELQEAAALGVESVVALQNKRQLAKLSLTRDSLEDDGLGIPGMVACPASAVTADPTVTFTEPTPQFAEICYAEPPNNTQHPKPTTTTLLPEQGVTEITWMNAPVVAASPFGAILEERPPTPGATPPKTPPQTPSSAFGAHPSPGRPKSESALASREPGHLPSCMKLENQSEASSPRPLRRPRFILPDQDDEVTPDTSAPEQRRSSLYHLGIDAHTCAEDPSCEQQEPTIYTTTSAPEVLKARRTNSSPFQSRMGSMIGASSGRKRSAVRKASQAPPSILDKVQRADSQTGFAADVVAVAYRSSAGGEPSEGGAAMRYERPRTKSSVDRMRAILAQYPPLPRPDDTGIYSAMTGARRPSSRGSLVSRGQRSGRGVATREVSVCSEDGEPHVCADEN
ncbi:uncharacterized protein E0L32_002462 [Thyridium curvatum]|uniref:Uncharacterized protein n=1 Tax=Thyridium curvatum TaxID=1093900 RepID=A0A507B658_9PEZI|nr:uncharacterized protein E0L32_002462 [Thyridium curvatum]TPX18605.1 hypothetical protein E0L32_002462 [Thyridium curvatum]